VLLVFLLCLTSFVVALTLGGGPRSTTLELAIYQALRFDFDLGRAAALAGLQFVLCALAVALAGRLAAAPALGTGLDRLSPPAAPGGWRRWGDAGMLATVTLFLCLPLGAVAWAGLGALGELPGAVWVAALRSLFMAVVSAGLATAGGLLLALAAARSSGWLRRGIDLAAMLPLAASGMVLGTGLFLALRPLAPPESLALPVTVLVNAAMALPFLYRLLLPEAEALEKGYARLSAALGLTGLPRLRLVTLPRLARPLGLGAGIAAALSMGDLGVIALFAGPDNATLPLIVQRLAGAYRMDQAAAGALLLVALSFTLFTLCDRGGRRAAA
jgi:thiamine transport system permease protein